MLLRAFFQILRELSLEAPFSHSTQPSEKNRAHTTKVSTETSQGDEGVSMRVVGHWDVVFCLYKKQEARNRDVVVIFNDDEEDERNDHTRIE